MNFLTEWFYVKKTLDFEPQDPHLKITMGNGQYQHLMPQTICINKKEC